MHCLFKNSILGNPALHSLTNFMNHQVNETIRWTSGNSILPDRLAGICQWGQRDLHRTAYFMFVVFHAASMKWDRRQTVVSAVKPSLIFFIMPGLFHIKTSALRECPLKWLDHKLDQTRVDDIAGSIQISPDSMHNSQPWLAIADVTKKDVEGNKNLIKGAKLELIGGLHGHAAYQKVGRCSWLLSITFICIDLCN